MTDHIEIYDNALDSALCEEIIKKFDHSEQRSGVTTGGVDKSKKDSFDINLSATPDWQALLGRVMSVTSHYLLEYMRKYSFLLVGPIGTTVRNPQTGKTYELTHEDIPKLSPENLGLAVSRLYRPGPIIAQKYLKGTGGYHQWHSEHCPRDASCETLHRVLFFMFYLNGVEEGGETAFFYQDRAVKPEPGRMVIAPAAFTHTHKGNIPISGNKYILTSWILFQRAENIRM